MKGAVMSSDDLVALILSVLIAGYLVFALLAPEKL
jgi:K+-transporting ATPase KdpF subunit